MAALKLDIKMVRAANNLSFTVHIVEQRLRGSKACFVASNGFYFSSLSCPAIGGDYNTGSGSSSTPMMYLRGNTRSNDNDKLYTRSLGYIEKLKAAVIEYNIAKEGIT